MALDLGFLLVLAYATLPVAGNFGGGLLAERITVSTRVLSLALHAATGVVVAVISVELIPTTLEVASPWVVLIGFGLGGGFFLVIDGLTDFVRARMGGSAAAGGGAIFLATSLDLFSDGLMIGAGSTLNPSLGLLLALGQVPADIPEGFATNASMKRAGIPRARRLLFMAAFAIPIFVGALLGFFLLRDRSDAFTAGVLAFTAGALTTLVIEELAPEAHEAREAPHPRAAGAVFVSGFLLFFLLTILFEGA